MPNVLKKDKQIAIISGLAEGMSMRALARTTGIHQDTIGRLGVRIGQGCAAVLDAKMRNLTCNFLQLDEIWGFIGKKQKHVSAGLCIIQTIAGSDIDLKFKYSITNRFIVARQTVC